MVLYSLAEKAAGKAATCISLALCLNLAMGKLQLCFPASGPIKKPKYLPKLVMFMSFHSGMLCASQFRTAKMFCSEQQTEVRIRTHLLGLRTRPEIFRNMLNKLAHGIRACRLRRAAPMSSAHANTLPSPGWTIVREKHHRSGSMPTLKSAPDRGQPCSTPEKTLNIRTNPPWLLV